MRLCSPDVAFTSACSRPFANVRNCSKSVPMAVPSAISATVVTSGSFTCRVASLRVASVALRDIRTCFLSYRESFSVARAIFLQHLQKMSCTFRGRRSTVDMFVLILRGRRGTLEKSYCMFFENRIVRAAPSGDNCKFHGKRGIFRDVLNIDGSLRETWILR